MKTALCQYSMWFSTDCTEFFIYFCIKLSLSLHFDSLIACLTVNPTQVCYLPPIYSELESWEQKHTANICLFFYCCDFKKASVKREMYFIDPIKRKIKGIHLKTKILSFLFNLKPVRPMWCYLFYRIQKKNTFVKKTIHLNANTLRFKSLRPVGFMFLKEIAALIKSDSKDIYSLTKYLYFK